MALAAVRLQGIARWSQQHKIYHVTFAGAELARYSQTRAPSRVSEKIPAILYNIQMIPVKPVAPQTRMSYGRVEADAAMLIIMLQEEGQ
jgi:hypothetical protein